MKNKMNEDKKNDKESNFYERSTTPESSTAYDGQNLTVMQSVIGQKFDKNADRSSSVWKIIKRIILIAIVVFCFAYVIYSIITGKGILLPRVR
jgi:hypothetical protein